MPSAISLRFYELTLKSRNSSKSALPGAVLQDYVASFIQRFSALTAESELSRTWYLEEKSAGNVERQFGYVHYGTFGYGSSLVDSRSKKVKYRRLPSDTEQIPLYFEFWFPKGEDYGLCAFQSFEGRSCMTLVLDKLKRDFDKNFPKELLSHRRLIPSNLGQSVYKDAPVRGLTLIKKNTFSDDADNYFGQKARSEIDLHVQMTAKPRKFLGLLGNLRTTEKVNGMTVLTYNGVEFSQAVAEIKVGKKIRRVGAFGLNTDAGAIDVTDSVTVGPNGHPTFDSIMENANDIFLDLNSKLSTNQ